MEGENTVKALNDVIFHQREFTIALVRQLD